MRNHYGFYYQENFRYWLSRIIPAGFGNTVLIVVGHIASLSFISSSNGAGYPYHRIWEGFALWIAVAFAVTFLLYFVFRVLDKKEWLKYNPVEIVTL